MNQQLKMMKKPQTYKILNMKVTILSWVIQLRMMKITQNLKVIKHTKKLLAIKMKALTVVRKK